MIRPGRLWWMFRRDLRRGWRPTRGEYLLAPKIWKTAPPSSLREANEDSPAVHVLTGNETATMCAWMLASWESVTETRWSYRIHNDGTLTKENEAALRRRFPSCQIVSPNQADEEVLPLLKHYPRCAEYRERHPLSRKCFDIPILSPTDRFLLLDSDVLFFRRPDFMIDWIENDGDGCWFNADPQEPCPIPPEEAVQEFGHELWPRVNSGLCLLHRAAFELEHFEHCLGSDRLREGNPWRIEQSLLALGASRRGLGGTLSETDYEVTLGEKRHPEGVARHYVGAVRHHFFGEGLPELSPALLTS